MWLDCGNLLSYIYYIIVCWVGYVKLLECVVNINCVTFQVFQIFLHQASQDNQTYFPFSCYTVDRKEIHMTGTIKTKTDRGFGFIAREGEAKDLFFHSQDLKGVTFDELQVGETVSFEVVDGPKGQSAKNVTRA